jgi:hypothetical protein
LLQSPLREELRRRVLSAKDLRRLSLNFLAILAPCELSVSIFVETSAFHYEDARELICKRLGRNCGLILDAKI